MRSNGARVARTGRHRIGAGRPTPNNPWSKLTSANPRRLAVATGLAALLGLPALSTGALAVETDAAEAERRHKRIVAALRGNSTEGALGQTFFLEPARAAVLLPDAGHAQPAQSAPPAEEPADQVAAEPAEEAAPTEPAPVAGLDQAQMNNAKRIVETARGMGLSERAQIIAVATAMQESTLYNRASTVIPESYQVWHEGDGSDHDSVGLFQQRPSSGWGHVHDLMRPEFATEQFLRALVRVAGWEQLPVTVAAQTVQVSAYPDHYAKHEPAATEIVAALNN